MRPSGAPVGDDLGLQSERRTALSELNGRVTLGNQVHGAKDTFGSSLYLVSVVRVRIR
jgi:hypothetical protein